MNINKIVKYVYVMYTLYLIMTVSITTMSMLDVLPGILIMWFSYGLFYLGFIYKGRFKKSKSNNENPYNWLNNQNNFTYLLIAIVSVIASILSVKFYTGQTPNTVISSLLNGSSLYLEYQNYFRINNIGMFSLSKLPFIMMLVIIKYILVYSHISFAISNDKIRFIKIIYLIVITFSSIYVGLARGTNFEFFELFVLLFYITLIKNKKKLSFSSFRSKIFIIVMAVFMSYVFYVGVSARGMEFGHRISADIYYNPKGLIPMISSFISFLVLMVFDYFGFGFFYMSRYIIEIWTNSISNFLGGFIPLGTKLLSNEKIIDQMKYTIDMGARWHPDTIVIIDNWGIIGFFIFCLMLGRVSRYIKDKTNHNNNSTITYITYYFILMQMIALPVGNFIQVSSSNKLIVFMLVFYWCWKLLKIPRIKFR